MNETKELLRRGVGGFEPTPDAFERVLARRDRKRRNQRVAAGVLGIGVSALAAIGFARLLGSEGTPASDPRSPFLGVWISTSDADGGTQTMTVRASADDAVEIVVTDDVATVCSLTPSTMTGTGRIEGGTALVIPSPVYTCDDGSEPETLSGPPLAEALRDWTLFLDAETDTLSDGVGGVWMREGAEVPSPGPVTSGGMWPQSSLEEVREAQRLADAGDPRLTWQVDPGMNEDTGPVRRVGGTFENAEIVDRFVREELGWEEFFPEWELVGWDQPFSNLTYIRCAPGGTNPLYPNEPEGRGCAPTIDDLRYEMVQLDLAQPGRQGPSGIWVVSGWETVAPFAQVAPPTDAEAAAVLEPFLQARIEGEGAEEYVDFADFGKSPTGEVPLLYATTTGAPYERFEFEPVGSPQWPFGETEFKVRLFAEGGETVVEQLFLMTRQETGRLGLEFWFTRPGATAENGQPVAEAYSFLDGEVTFDAAWPWYYFVGGWGFGPTMTTLELDDPDQQRFDQLLKLVADPLPVESGCRQGPAPADAEALARSIRSDPDLEATEPVAVSVGGTQALKMDVVAAPGASVCETVPAPQVLTPNDNDWPGVALEYGQRMRLYLLDLPEGMSARTLAIAISAPEADFEHVTEAAAPIVDSFEFHTP